MAANPLTGPSGPSPWGASGTNVVPAGTPRITGNALMIPRAAPVAPAPVAGPAMPPLSETPPEERISPRVPVPKSHFPEGEHKDLHERMGEAFDNPGAQKFVHNLYNRGRSLHPDIEPRHLLETIRDHYHAIRHGFMGPEVAGAMIPRMARQRQAEAQEHSRWFGNSRVVDDAGKPLRVFHGTNAEIHDFGGEPSSKTGNVTGPLGHFFSPSPQEASRYASDWGTEGGNVMPVHLSIQNPHEMPWREFDNMAMAPFRKERTEEEGRAYAAALRDDLIRRGHDGIFVMVRGKPKEYIAFHPHQIRSSIGR